MRLVHLSCPWAWNQGNVSEQSRLSAKLSVCPYAFNGMICALTWIYYICTCKTHSSLIWNYLYVKCPLWLVFERKENIDIKNTSNKCVHALLFKEIGWGYFVNKRKHFYLEWIFFRSIKFHNPIFVIVFIISFFNFKSYGQCIYPNTALLSYSQLATDLCPKKSYCWMLLCCFWTFWNSIGVWCL